MDYIYIVLSLIAIVIVWRLNTTKVLVKSSDALDDGAACFIIDLLPSAADAKKNKSTVEAYLKAPATK